MEYNKARALENLIRINSWLVKIKNDGCNGVVLGLSGGKDSTVVAMLAKLVWGNNVLGLIMPNQSRDDVFVAASIAKRLALVTKYAPIDTLYDDILDENDEVFTAQAQSNIAPRLRMTMLYLYAQNLGYRVIGTGNRSELYIGWCTKHGDMACDFNPIAHLTCTEVIELGHLLADMFNLPHDYIERPPADGITGRTDEENFGFTYKQLDAYLLEGSSGDPVIDTKIEKMHEVAKHKLTMPATMK